MKSVNTYIELMKNGDRNAILKSIALTPEILQLNAILFGTKYKIKEQSLIEGIKNINKTSNAVFFGVPIQKYAIAALDCLGIEKYKGNDDFIIRLIESNFNDV